MAATEDDPLAGLTAPMRRVLDEWRALGAKPAESLPVADGSVDGVFFFRSLHHVPVEHMDTALAEAMRVLKPGTGFLCVIEPAVTGTYFKVMRPFHDETLVRAHAQAALGRLATTMFLEAQIRAQYSGIAWIGDCG